MGVGGVSRSETTDGEKSAPKSPCVAVCRAQGRNRVGAVRVRPTGSGTDFRGAGRSSGGSAGGPLAAMRSLPASSPGSAIPVNSSRLTCRLCGAEHRSVALEPGERATCARCGTLLAQRGRFGPHAPLAFAVTGVLLAVPAVTLPFITVSKFGNARVSLIYTGAVALWEDGMRLLAVWVFICGTLAPLLLFALLFLMIGARRDFGPIGQRRLARTAHALEHWAMPEVLVLAVLVALIKLGSLVNVHIGPAFWCYAAMSVLLVLAWRSFEFEATEPGTPQPAGDTP